MDKKQKQNDNYKEVNIGKLIEKKWKESEIDIIRVCAFFGCDEEEIKKSFLEKSMESDAILRWSKLLEYDFFRIYSQHLILYAPAKGSGSISPKVSLLEFRKNIYTKELIEFIIETIETGEKTRLQVIEEYRIPKTTLYKWLVKYKKNES